MDFFILFKDNFINNFLCFILIFAIQFALIITFLFLSIFKANFSIKKRAIFLFASIVNLTVCKCIEKAYSISFLFEFIFFMAFISLIPLFYIRVKERKVKDEEKTFIRQIDEKIKENGNEEILSPMPLKVEPVREKPIQTLNYSHIKGLIRKLEFCSLSPIERNVVSNLEVSVFKAERGDKSEEGANNIKEGLSALLKIMAKYGA